MKKAAVTATFAFLVVVGHASSGIAAQDDLPDEAAIADHRILAVDDGKESPLTDQPFTRESGFGAFAFDAFEHTLSERSLPTLPMLKTEEALAHVIAEEDLSDEATVAEQRLLGRDEEGKRLVAYQPSTGQIDGEVVLTNVDQSGIGEAESDPVMLGVSKRLVGRQEEDDRFAAYQPFTREIGAEAVISDWFAHAPGDSTMPTAAVVEPRWQLAGVTTEENRLGEAAIAEQRLLGSDDEDDRFAAYQPFTREIGVDGLISDSFEEAISHAAVPAATMLEAKQALATAIDLGCDVQRGDRFYVRYEQQFTAAGAAVGVGRVLSAELRTQAKGTIAIHRFRTRDQVERFYLPNGQSATPTSMRLPLDVVTISSGFGLRADPFDQPAPIAAIGKPAPMGGPNRNALPPGLQVMVSRSANDATLGLTSPLGKPFGFAPFAGLYPSPARQRVLFMHDGIDLVAPAGTPVYATGDGVVVGAEPNGRYGNWIRIEHGQNLATVYGHLMAFAPGIEPGERVVRGELIGFVGSTGRSTGAHLHFELQKDGKPVNPINSPELKALQLGGLELERFRKRVAASVAEREREAKVRMIGPSSTGVPL
jgi:murein DD-endopeptidase MepM/ murein hydrolase activator NlpD